MDPLRLDEWLTELKRIEATKPDGFAREDVEDALNIRESRAHDLLRRWFRKGLIEFAGRKQGNGIDGRVIYTPVYRMKKKND